MLINFKRAMEKEGALSSSAKVSERMTLQKWRIENTPSRDYDEDDEYNKFILRVEKWQKARAR